MLRITKAYVLVVMAAFLISFVLPAGVSADSLIQLSPAGQVTINVLAAESESGLSIPQSDYLKVKSHLADSGEFTQIALTRSSDKTTLSVGTGNYLDVSGIGSDLVEVEERPATHKFSIATSANGFVLTQDGVMATTSYDIHIDPLKARLTLATPTGDKYLAILPKEAVDSTIRSGVLSKVVDGGVAIVENAGSELVYKVSGNKVLNLFNLYNYQVPVTANVSASTAQIVSVDQPPWLVVITYLFG